MAAGVCGRDGGQNVSLSLLYAWSRRGERTRARAPRNRGKNVTLLASITAEGVGPCLAGLKGATRREVFEAYLERVLAPSLRPCGQIVVVDNLYLCPQGQQGEGDLRGGRVRALAYLPPYSPDLSPR